MNGRGAAALRFAAALLAAAACFFVGRRIYYRLIQPPPPWEHPTPKNERVVAAAGLEVSLWADETLVHNPTSLSIDARGRVWVTEAVNYREWQNHQRDAGTAFHPGGAPCTYGRPSGFGSGIPRCMPATSTWRKRRRPRGLTWVRLGWPFAPSISARLWSWPPAVRRSPGIPC